MTAENVEERLREIMSVVLKRPIADGEEVCRDREVTWDSLKHVELLFAIEGALDVTFDPEEMPMLTTLEKFVASVKAHRAS